MGRQNKTKAKSADAPTNTPSAPPATNGNNGSLKELLKELWKAAVKLRGSIEPADYKRYVLPINFLRFLSLRYDRRRAELERLIADPKSDYHTTNKKHADTSPGTCTCTSPPGKSNELVRYELSAWKIWISDGITPLYHSPSAQQTQELASGNRLRHREAGIGWKVLLAWPEGDMAQHFVQVVFLPFSRARYRPPAPRPPFLPTFRWRWP